jgi:chemotaxis protein CheX
MKGPGPQSQFASPGFVRGVSPPMSGVQPMVEGDRSVFSSTLVQVCNDMFSDAVGFAEISPAEPPRVIAAGDDTIVASVGLAGQDFRGALIVHAPPEFFARSYPPSLNRVQVSEAAMIDWAGEISNQLLGRLKNRLGRLGLDFAISTPTVVRGDNLTLNAPLAASVQHALRIANARAVVVFHIEHDAGKPLLPASGPVVVATLEGEALLF